MIVYYYSFEVFIETCKEIDHLFQLDLVDIVVADTTYNQPATSTLGYKVHKSIDSTT